MKWSASFVEVTVDAVEGTSLEHAQEIERLIRDQVAERDAESGNGRLKCSRECPVAGGQRDAPVPTIVPVTSQDSASRANASQVG